MLEQTAETKKSKEDTFGLIDACITMCDKLSDVEAASNSLTNYGYGPFNFLINIGISLGIYNEMLEWLEKFIIYFMPVLEWTSKGIILTNLKTKISCNEDPRIPNDFRLNQPDNYEKEHNENILKGFVIDIQGIDYTNMLSISPLEENGKNIYFGNINTSVDSFARANDMNAFLWYVIHKGIHQKSITITGNTIQEYFTNYNNSTVSENATALSSYTVKGNSKYGILVGTTFSRKDSNLITACINHKIYETTKFNSIDKKIEINRNWESTIVPLSYNNDTINWYYDSSALKVSLVEAKTVKSYKNKIDSIKRNYNSEFPILQFKYYNSDVKSLITKKLLGKKSYSNLQNKLQIAVLPKPFQLLPPSFELPDNLKDIFNGNILKFKYILFNEKGEQDKHGHYSCLIESDVQFKPIYDENKPIFKYKLSDVKFKSGGYLIVNYKEWKYGLYYDIEGTNIISSEDDLSQILYECYPKLTVYELMTDLVFGNRIFDSKTICAQLIDSVINLRLGSSFSISPPTAKYVEKVNNIVKNIIESEGTEIDDCFFNFSNDRFSEMIEKSNNLRKNNYSFIGDTLTSVVTNTSAITNILSEYSEESTKEENKEIIHRAFITTINSISENVSPSQSLSIKCNIITQFMQNLMSSVIINLISPKVTLLFEMEKQLMGDNSESLSFESFFNSISSILVSLINEIGDMIINELKKLIFSKLEDIAACMAIKISKEQIENYTIIIKNMIKTCSFKLNSNNNELLNTDIINVNYADITNTPLKNNKC